MKQYVSGSTIAPPPSPTSILWIQWSQDFYTAKFILLDNTAFLSRQFWRPRQKSYHSPCFYLRSLSNNRLKLLCETRFCPAKRSLLCKNPGQAAIPRFSLPPGAAAELSYLYKWLGPSVSIEQKASLELTSLPIALSVCMTFLCTLYVCIYVHKLISARINANSNSAESDLIGCIEKYLLLGGQRPLQIIFFPSVRPSVLVYVCLYTRYGQLADFELVLWYSYFLQPIASRFVCIVFCENPVVPRSTCLPLLSSPPPFPWIKKSF